MSLKTFHRKGAYNAICDVCGHKFKSYTMKTRWDGMWVCKQDFEHRHPSDLFNPNLEEKTPDITRPPAADVFVAGAVCTTEGGTGWAGQAVAGCAQPAHSPTLE